VCCVSGFNPAIVPDGLSSLWASGGSNINFSVELFLGAFAKLRKAIISFVMSVSVRPPLWKNSSHWTDFHEIWYLSIFRKSVERI